MTKKTTRWVSNSVSLRDHTHPTLLNRCSPSEASVEEKIMKKNDAQYVDMGMLLYN